MSLLVRSPNWLGDAIIAMPAVAQLICHSGKPVSILAPSKLHEVWKLVSGIRDILPVDKNIFHTAGTLRSGKFETALIFPNSLRTGLEPFLAGVPERVGYTGHWRKFLLTRAFEKELSTQKRHQKWDYLHLVQKAGYPTDEHADLPDIEKPEIRLMAEPYLAVCPGAEYGPAKRWPAERFAETGSYLAKKYGLSLLLLGADCDRASAEEVEAQSTGVRCVNLAGKTSLSEFIQYLAYAEFVLSNDSGAMHLAALLRKRGIALFGSTDSDQTGPLSDTMRVLREPVSCSPCFLRSCPSEFRCMKDITVDMVNRLADEMLSPNEP